MKEKRYETQHDVSLRLHNCVLKYKQDYYYGMIVPRLRTEEDRASSDTRIGLYTLKDHGNMVEQIDANDPDLDISSIPLGYMEGQKWNVAYYISRAPYRRQKQGVSSENTRFFYPEEKVEHAFSNDLFFYPGFKKMLKGDYINYHSILASIKKTAESKVFRPFDRSFCVCANKKEGKTILQHNLEDIGDVNLDNGFVYLYPEHNHSVFALRLAELGVIVA